jgi:hypothetical protein
MGVPLIVTAGEAATTVVMGVPLVVPAGGAATTVVMGVPLVVPAVVDEVVRCRRPPYPKTLDAVADAACTVPISATLPAAESPLQPLSRPVTVRLKMQRVEAERNLVLATARAPVR